MSIGLGFGKTILFGEHFVVHSIPAIASALDLKTEAEITTVDKKGIFFIDESRKTFGSRKISYFDDPDDILSKLLTILLKELQLDSNELHIQITLKSSVPEFGGAGLSAALSVSLVKAFSNHYNLGLTNEQVTKIAYEGEKMFHGTPSGIDNTIATYGGLLWFVRGNPNLIEPLNSSSKGLLVIGDTRIHHNTKELVAEVRRKKETEPDVYDPIFARASKLVLEARKQIEQGNWSEVGKLMNENHALLQKIGVSIPELDKMVQIARNSGALGSKLTGGGGGGCMIALAPDEETQQLIAKNIESAGFHSYLTTIG